jgi:tRNA-splicing ligase RtcB
MAFDIKSWEDFKITGQTIEGIIGTYKGKTLAIYDKDADLIAMNTLNQMLDALQSEYAVAGALMPDGHLGYALPIGGVMGTKEHICPAWVGYDIGCGVTSIGTTFDWQDVKGVSGGALSCMYAEIPTGFKHHDEPQTWEAWQKIPKSDFLKKEFADRGLYQIGTMGGNNHFIEIGRSTVEDRVWITVHSGSRNIGHKAATHYMREASPDDKVREGHHFLHIKDDIGMQYVRDVNFCTRFAFVNRLYLIHKTVEILKYFLEGEIDPQFHVDCSHNSVVYEPLYDLWVHRKGATIARQWVQVAIPANRAEGIFIGQGKGNPRSMSSCSHGAGRRFSRKKAKEELDRKQAQIDMKGVQAITHANLIDEAPRAYKPISKVMQSQESLVTIKETIKPLINFKDLRKLTLEEALEFEDEEQDRE